VARRLWDRLRSRSPYTRRLALVAVSATATLVPVIALALKGGDDARDADAKPVPGPGGMTVGGQPRGIAVGEGAVWVTRHDDGQVSRIDLASGSRDAIDVGDAPDRIAAGEGSIWVAVAGGTRLVRIDPSSREVTTRLNVDTRAMPNCDCASPALEITHGALWVASPRKRTVTKRDVVTGAQTREPYRVDAGFSGAFAIGPGALWVVGNDDSTGAWKARIDLASGEAQRTDAGSGSYLAAIAYGEQRLWVADAADGRNTVAAVDPSSGESTDVKVETGVSSDDLAVVEGAVLAWEPDNGVLTAINPAALKVASTHRVRGYANGQRVNLVRGDLDADNDDGYAWVSDPAGDAIYKIRY
jgi:hypothetical protein